MEKEKEKENKEKEENIDIEKNMDTEPNHMKMETEMEMEMETKKWVMEKGGSMNQLSIHLGDILRISSPENLKYHEKTFLVDYCGKKNMIWIDVESGMSFDLKLVGKQNEELEEKEGIDSIELLSREEYPGYAKQNGLEVGIWLDIEFGGDVPFLVTGLITNLEEDQIEITSWPNQDVFYFDFQYEGLWAIIPKIEKIQIRDPPSVEAEQVMAELRESNVARNGELDYLIDGEVEEREDMNASLENEEAETNRLERLREEYVQGTAFAKSIIPEIEYGEVLGNYYQRVEQRKEEVRYSLNAQLEDFMNELLSTIPNYMRTPQVMEEVENTLLRFRELHGIFARLNQSGAVTGYRSNRFLGKPLVSSMLEIGGGEEENGKWIRNTGWVIPVVYMRKKGWHDIISENETGYKVENNDEDGYFNIPEEYYNDGSSGEEWIQNPACVWLKGIQQAVDKWVSGAGNGGYRRLLQELDGVMSPVFLFTREQIMDAAMMSREGEMIRRGEKEGESGWNLIGPYEAGLPLETIIDNTAFRKEGVFGNRESDGFYSTISQGGYGEKMAREDVVLARRRFVIQKVVDSVSLLAMRWSNSGKKTLERDTVVENEKMCLKSVILLPEHWMAFSQIGLPGTDILTRVRLGSWWPQMSRILNKNSSVETVEIDDLTRDFAYSNLDGKRCNTTVTRLPQRKRRFGGAGGVGTGAEGENGEFLDGIREYILAKENVKSSGAGTGNALEKLLNTIIPNNLYLIDFMCSYLQGSQYSLSHYARLLEPFGIYSWNMRYTESYVMQKKIRDKMSEYRVTIENRRKEYGVLEQFYKKNEWGVKYRTTERLFQWIRNRGDEFTTSFLDWYHLNIGALTTSEMLTRIFNLDNGELLSSIMNYLHYALITLNRFTIRGGGVVDEWLGNWGEGEEEKRISIYGGRLNLAKRYASVSELREDDNRTDIHWDKSLDVSPYHLAKRYGDETGGAVGEEVSGIIGGIALNIKNENENMSGGDDDETAFPMNETVSGGGVHQTMRQKLSESEFLEYLAMNLKERHLCPAEQAVELANILMNGKRPVKGGDYASVQLGGGDIGYYQRKHHNWIRDTSLDYGKEMDEKRVFSNLEKVGGGLGVFYGDDETRKKGGLLDEREIVTLSGDVEESKRIAKWEKMKMSKKKGGAENTEEEIEKKREKELAKEMFHQKIQQSLKELESSFEKKMEEQIARIVRIYALKQTDLKRANTFAYYLGKYKKVTDMRISPHANLLELILEESDFALKQQYIVRFYHAFCREPILGGVGGLGGVEEKGYWKYCSETNVPLLPTSYFDLAMEYMNGGDYGQLLELLCSQIGNESSDGESIIDRFTGRVLKKKDLDIEEGFDDMGFQRKTRDVLGDMEESGGGDLGESSAAEGRRVQEEERQLNIEDAGEEEGDDYLKEIDEALAVGNTAIVNKRTAKTAKEYGEGDNEIIANVAFYLLHEMGIMNSVESQEWIEELMNFVIQTVSELLANKEFIETEKRFEQKRKLALEQAKKFPFESYMVFKNQKLLYASVATLLVGIQTVTTEMKLSKNATNCIRSLKGYPTGMGGSGKDDKSALRYIVCLLLQQQSDEAPWNARNSGKKEETHMNIMTEYVDKYLLGNRAVEDRIGARRAYEAEHGETMEESIPLVLRMERQNLLPPMEKNMRIEDRQIVSVSREFLEEWKEEMRKSLKLGGGLRDGGSEAVVRMKLVALGYSLFENVNTEVARQIRGFLMKTMLGEPYLENACCQSEGMGAGQVPLRYFVEKNPLIGKVLKNSRLLERALNTAESPKKTVLLYHAESTRIGNGDFWDRGNGSSYFKANIYAALIHYFNYDRPLLPVPEYLREKIYEEPPKGYPIGGILKEKIEFLEKAGRNYDVEKLQYCLTLVGQQNILSKGGELADALLNEDDAMLKENDAMKIGEALGDFLTNSIFENVFAGKRNMEGYENFIQKLTDVFREWNRGTMQNNTSPKIRALNSFLAKSNAEMFERISKEWKPSGEKERELLVFLEKVQLWKLAGDIDRDSLNRANSDSLQQIVRFIRNMCNMFAFSYKQRIDVMQDFNTAGKKALPKHWGFADEHYVLLAEYIRKTFGSLIRRRDSTDDMLFQFFERISLEDDGLFRQIRQLLAFFPVFTPLSLVVGENGEREVFYSLFPKETCYGVHVFCLYFILTRYLDISQVATGVRVRKPMGRSREDELFVSVDDAVRGVYDEQGVIENYTIAVQEDLEDRQIWEGRQLSWKEKIRQFFYDCLEVERDNKEVADNTYDQLRQKQDETEKREKKRITDGLKELDIYQRRVEIQMKDLKLGNWNVGQQKGLFQYDKETFNREMIEQQYGIVLDAGEGVGEAGGRGVLYDTEQGGIGDDYLNGSEADRLRDMELNGDILGLGEDWDDGGEFE